MSASSLGAGSPRTVDRNVWNYFLFQIAFSKLIYSSSCIYFLSIMFRFRFQALCCLSELSDILIEIEKVPSIMRWCFTPLLSPRVRVLQPLQIMIFHKNVFLGLVKNSINSQSLEDTQVGYTSHLYTLDNYPLEKCTLEKLTFSLFTLRKYTPNVSPKTGEEWCGAGGKWCGSGGKWCGAGGKWCGTGDQ